MSTATALKLDRIQHLEPLPREEPVEKKTTELHLLKDSLTFDVLKTLFSQYGTLKELIGDDVLKDDGGIALPCNLLIKTTDIHNTAKLARELGIKIVVIGALTSATKNFSAPGMSYGKDMKILAISPVGITNDRDLKSTEKTEYIENKSNQLIINEDRFGAGRHSVTIGAGLTFGQANEIIQIELGPDYYIPVDLTTVNHALAGAVYATGAMGPSRIRPHEVIRRVNITDGKSLHSYIGEEIEKHEGLLGLNGGITEMEVEVLKIPKHKFGLSVPLKITAKNQGIWPKKVAEFLAEMHPYTDTRIEDGKIKSQWEKGYIDGIEIFTAEELEMVSKKSASPEIVSKAMALLETMKENNSSYLLYLTGRAEEDIFELIEDENDNPIIKLIELSEDGKIGEAIDESNKIKLMKNLREAVPEIARTEARTKERADILTFSTSTDANTSINPEYRNLLSPDELTQIFHKILEPYLEYEEKIQELTEWAKKEGIQVITRRYGHMNPRNIDAHTRVTVKGSSENFVEFQIVTDFVKKFKAELLKQIKNLPQEDPRIITTHGEKGKIPGKSFLTEKQNKESLKRIQEAGATWNFRMPQL